MFFFSFFVSLSLTLLLLLARCRLSLSSAFIHSFIQLEVTAEKQRHLDTMRELRECKERLNEADRCDPRHAYL
jgi:hypothetical protein